MFILYKTSLVSQNESIDVKVYEDEFVHKFFESWDASKLKDVLDIYLGDVSKIYLKRLLDSFSNS